MGIYKRKHESKKTSLRPRKRSRKKERKHALDQESDQEKRKTFFFLTFLFSFINSHLWVKDGIKMDPLFFNDFKNRNAPWSLWTVAVGPGHPPCRLALCHLPSSHNTTPPPSTTACFLTSFFSSLKMSIKQIKIIDL